MNVVCVVSNILTACDGTFPLQSGLSQDDMAVSSHEISTEQTVGGVRAMRGII